MPSDPTSLTLHDLSLADAGRGFLLSTEIGWNQVEADWRYMLSNGTGVGMTDPAGKLVASAIALPYGRFGWVCMVLVAPDWRRLGIATDLMKRVIDRLEADGIVPGLDATPAGREVYRQLGFNDIYGLKRLVAEAAALDASIPGGMTIRPVVPSDMPELSRYDREVFGADREPLLRHLAARQPGRAVAAYRNGNLAGFALAREGRTWTQIGPVAAENEVCAKALVAAAARGGSGPANLLVDAIDAHPGMQDWLLASGFEFQRPYIRMIRGRSSAFDDAEKLFALAGPELG